MLKIFYSSQRLKTEDVSSRNGGATSRKRVSPPGPTLRIGAEEAAVTRGARVDTRRFGERAGEGREGGREAAAIHRARDRATVLSHLPPLQGVR